MKVPPLFHFTPGRVLLFSFLFAITLGTILLALPQSRLVSIPLVDLFFTATSATCVTGLLVTPLSYFTPFGHVVLLCLIQLGGLGLMTLSFFFLSLFLNLGMTTQAMAGEILEFRWWSKIKTFLFLIVSITLITELIGAACLYFPFRKTFPPMQAAFHALFHSVSAFCNAGITLFPHGKLPIATNPLSLGVLALLVFFGGIGFIVWFELASKFSVKKRFHLSLHSKIVLSTSFLLIIGGAVLTWLLEHNHSIKQLNLANGLIISVFNSISIRCAGFQIFNLEQATLATLLLFMFLMYIGASPGSTGSGIKTTTFAIFCATIAAIVKNRKDVELFGRKIPQTQVYKAISIIGLSFAWIFVLTFILLITEPQFSFIQIFFESVSAISTTGLSTGITKYLSTIGKLLLSVTMIVGRIGSLTLVLALRKKQNKLPYKYPEESVAIG